MAGIALSIILDKPDKTYEGGETIAGQVRVAVAEDVRTAALMVVLYCKGYSEKKTRIAGPEIATMEREIEETNLFKGPWTPGEYTYPFCFTAPPGPRTYKGHVFDVTWHIGAKVRTSRGKDKDVKAEENIILLPGKRASQRSGGKRRQRGRSQAIGKKFDRVFWFFACPLPCRQHCCMDILTLCGNGRRRGGIVFLRGDHSHAFGSSPDCWCHISGPDKQEDQKSRSETRFRAGQAGRSKFPAALPLRPISLLRSKRLVPF